MEIEIASLKQKIQDLTERNQLLEKNENEIEII